MVPLCSIQHAWTGRPLLEPCAMLRFFENDQRCVIWHLICSVVPYTSRIYPLSWSVGTH